MSLTLITPPTVEPVSLTELKNHLRIDSGTIADALSIKQTILAGSHGLAPAYGLVGATIDVAGYAVLAILTAGTYGAGSTEAKLQDSADGIAWADVVGAAFPTITVANDELTYELAYSGTKQYLRAVATVAGAACEFGVAFVLDAPVSMEDTVLSRFIASARRYCENYQNRAYITQTWELALDTWPDVIKIPKPPLQTVDSIEYYDTVGALNLLAAASYQVDIRGYVPRVSPVYGGVWPSIALRAMSGIVVTFTAGYGNAAVDVPEDFRIAVMMLAGHLYEHREASEAKALSEIPFGVHALLGMERVWP